MAPTTGQRLLQDAEVPATRSEREAAERGGGPRGVLLWLTTLVLYASFVGLVRAEAAPSPAGDASPPQLQTRSPSPHRGSPGASIFLGLHLPT